MSQTIGEPFSVMSATHDDDAYWRVTSARLVPAQVDWHSTRPHAARTPMVTYIMSIPGIGRRERICQIKAGETCSVIQRIESMPNVCTTFLCQMSLKNSGLSKYSEEWSEMSETVMSPAPWWTDCGCVFRGETST
jgi:hypothetical protein